MSCIDFIIQRILLWKFFRTETGRLKHNITQQKDDERKAALQQLSKLKDEELISAKAGWEKIISEMQKQVNCLYLNRCSEKKKMYCRLPLIYKPH